MGDIVAAVDRYQDIPVDVRERLKSRMVRRAYDDVVSIRRDSITGRARYGSTIRDMHFGDRQLCRSVTRAAWSQEMQERGLVYCDSGHCILVPTVCRNVSRIARAEVANEHAEGDVPGDDAAPAAPQAADAAPAPPLESIAAVLTMDEAASFTALSEGGHASGGAFGGGGPGLAGNGGGGGAATARASGGPDFVPLAVSDVGLEAITPVPEPETWGLILGGLAALGWRRRKRAA
ncbi:MAG: MHFG family PEP-CTERM protein [Pseudomonadota bacterium]|nr:MHFG family PEP-CTERM protein [Pseudomonadota bacterium]